MGLAETAQLAVRIGLDDKLSPGLRKASGNLSKFESSTKRVGGGIGKLAGGLARVGVVAGGAVAVGLGAAIKVAGDFEAQLNTINTIAHTNTVGLAKIGDGIRSISRETGVATEDLTAAYYDLLSAGIKAADAQSLLNNAVTLGIGGLATTAETVDLLTTAYNAYGLDAKGAAIATDQFAQAINDGKVKASEIASTFANVASIAHTAGIGIDQIAASYGFLTAQGVPAAETTTQMSRAIIELIKPGAQLVALQKKLGTNYADLARKKGLVPALEQMRKDAEKTGVKFQDLFGRLEGYKFALATTGPKFKAFMAEQAKILNSNGIAMKQAAERQKGFNYSMSVLTANIKDAGITIGSYLLPPLAKLAQKASAFLRRDDVQKKLKELGESLAKAIDGIDFDKLVDAASGFAKALDPALQTLKLIVQMISKLPPELLGAGAGLAVANKVSGGAISGGIGQIVGGLGSALAKSLAANIPVFGKAFVQPVFVTNMGAGLPGGGGAVPVGGKGGTSALGKAGSVIGGLIVVGTVAEIADAVKPAITGFGIDLHKKFLNFLPDIGLNDLEWPFGPKNTPTILPDVFGGNGILGGKGRVNTPNPNHEHLGPPAPSRVPQGVQNSFRAGERAFYGKMPKPERLRPSIHQLQERLSSVLRRESRAERAGQTRTAARLARKSDELRSRITHLTNVAAQKLAATKKAQDQTSRYVQATKRAIDAKKLAVKVNTTVNTTTSVAYSDIAKQTTYHSRTGNRSAFTAS